MVITAPVVAAAVESRRAGEGCVEHPVTPDGRRLDQARLELSAPAEPSALRGKVRGHRRTGAPARPLRRGDFPRRLRSPGRRGRRTRDRGGPFAPRARGSSENRSPSSASPSRGPPGLPALHPPPRIPRPDRPGSPPLRRPRENRTMAPGRSPPTNERAPSRPVGPSPARKGRREGLDKRPAARLRCSRQLIYTDRSPDFSLVIRVPRGSVRALEAQGDRHMTDMLMEVEKPALRAGTPDVRTRGRGARAREGARGREGTHPGLRRRRDRAAGRRRRAKRSQFGRSPAESESSGSFRCIRPSSTASRWSVRAPCAARSCTTSASARARRRASTRRGRRSGLGSPVIAVIRVS